MLKRLSTTTAAALAVGVALCTSAPAKAGFSTYPAFGDSSRYPGYVEAVIDKSLILELVVRCEGSFAIIAYSKIEKRYCGPSHTCWGSLERAARDTCSGR